MKPLQNAIAELYRVFRPYRVGETVDFCSHCVNEREARELGRADLSSLSVRDLDRFAQNAMTTWGDENYFRHFLPRLLELVSQFPDDFTSVEVLFGKLSYGKWLSWPKGEQEAINEYMRTLWFATLSTPPVLSISSIADTILCAIGNAVPSIEPFLTDWINAPKDPAALHFSRFVEENADCLLRKQRLSSAFWNGATQNASAVVEWLTQSPAPSALADAAVERGDTMTRPMLDGIRSAFANSPGSL